MPQSKRSPKDSETFSHKLGLSTGQTRGKETNASRTSRRSRTTNPDEFNSFVKNLRAMEGTHRSKNQDYSGDRGTYYNFEFAALLADQFDDPIDKVFASVLGIKLARLAVLRSSDKEPNNESVLDSFGDLATYCTIWWTNAAERIE